MNEADFRSQVVEPPFDYATAAEKTNSIVFNPQFIDKMDFVTLLRDVIANAEAMNIFKKLFFRGRTPADMMVDQPLRDDSLGPLLDGATPDETNILHGIVGVITEAGEMAELLLAFVEGKPFDPVHLLEESGDVEWYQHRILRGINATANLRDRANIDKLHGRHGEAFNVFRDAHRDLSSERAKLEVAAAPLLDHNRESSDELSSLAARTLRDPLATDREKSLAGSVLSQDEHKGPRKLEDEAGLSDVTAVPPRVRNDPPLPEGAASAPIVGNGGENITKKNVGDVEGMDC